jgi:hypothetical protein
MSLFKEVRANPIFMRLTARRRGLSGVSLIIISGVVIVLVALGIVGQFVSTGTNETIVFVTWGAGFLILMSALFAGVVTSIATAQDTHTEPYRLQIISTLPASKMVQGYFWASIVRLEWLWVVIVCLLSILCLNVLALASFRCSTDSSCSLTSLFLPWLTLCIGLVMVVVATHHLSLMVAIGSALSSRSTLKSVGISITVILFVSTILWCMLASGLMAIIDTYSPILIGLWCMFLGASLLIVTDQVREDMTKALHRQIYERM